MVVFPDDAGSSLILYDVTDLISTPGEPVTSPYHAKRYCIPLNEWAKNLFGFVMGLHWFIK